MATPSGVTWNYHGTTLLYKRQNVSRLSMCKDVSRRTFRCGRRDKTRWRTLSTLMYRQCVRRVNVLYIVLYINRPVTSSKPDMFRGSTTWSRHLCHYQPALASPMPATQLVTVGVSDTVSQLILCVLYTLTDNYN